MRAGYVLYRALVLIGIPWPILLIINVAIRKGISLFAIAPLEKLAIGNSMWQIKLMHRVVQYRAEFHTYQEILPCALPPCALIDLTHQIYLPKCMQIRKCLFFIVID